MGNNKKNIVAYLFLIGKTRFTWMMVHKTVAFHLSGERLQIVFKVILWRLLTIVCSIHQNAQRLNFDRTTRREDGQVNWNL
jgi:hypothetical protein